MFMEIYFHDAKKVIRFLYSRFVVRCVLTCNDASFIALDCFFCIFF